MRERAMPDVRENYRSGPLKDVLFYVLGAASVCAVGFHIVSLTTLSQDTSKLHLQL